MGEDYSTVYSTEVAKESYDTVAQVFEEKLEDKDLRNVMTDLFTTFGRISETLRTSKQLGVDVVADASLWDVAKNNPLVKEGASSLEGAYSSNRVRETHPVTGKFSLVWDPLDGGARGSDILNSKNTHAIVDNNWAVGSLVGIYPSSKGIVGAKGRDQVGSMVALYGPRTTVLVNLDDGVYEFTYGCFNEDFCLIDDLTGEPLWICSRERIEIAPKATIFSAANLRATQDLPAYQELIKYWGENSYSLRYTGAFVSDISQQFTKRQGVFSNPTSQEAPAKLPLCYAALPFALLVEKAGGKTSDGVTGGSILDVTIEALDQLTPVCMGSTQEVERFNSIVLGDGPALLDGDNSMSFPPAKDLKTVLVEKMKDENLRSLYHTMFDAFKTITEALQNELVTVADKQNSQFGDVQLGVDVLADDLLWDVCKADPLVKEAASEEEPEVRLMHEDGKYSIVWDPLDGSSIVDNNWAVGTILAIWPASTGIIGATGRDQVASMVALYGPRTTAYVTLDDGVYEFTLGDDGWSASKERIEIAKESEIFSWGNVKAAQGGTPYGELINYWMSNRYTLRVSGGLVPDVCQLFTKGRGVFCYPETETAPAKLRLAFEAAPFAHLVEMCGGKTSDGVTGGSLRDVKITGIDQRTPVIVGSGDEVDRFNKVVLEK